MTDCTFTNISMLLSRSYIVFFKLYMDFTGWLDNAINCMCPSIDQRKQQLTETSPLIDECIPVLKTRLLLIHYRNHLPCLHHQHPKGYWLLNGTEHWKNFRNTFRTIDTHRRQVLGQRDSDLPGSTIVRYNIHRKFTVTE